MNCTARSKEMMERAVAPTLVSVGWKEEFRGAAFASKEYETIVAPKIAHLYVQDFGPQEDCLVLTGTFYSGVTHNHLSCCFTLISRAASQTLIESLVSKFAAQVEQVISETFSVRLLRTRCM